MKGTAQVLEDESALVVRAQASLPAFAPIYEHYFPRVYTYVRYRILDRAAADDLTAQIFERVLAGIPSYRPERAPFGAWLFAIARNTVNDYLRALRRRRWLSFERLADHPSSDPPPEVVAARWDIRQRLLEAVAQLNERDRDLIALKFSAGLNNRRIAEMMGMSESNVGVSLYRAIRRLRELLKGEEIIP